VDWPSRRLYEPDQTKLFPGHHTPLQGNIDEANPATYTPHPREARITQGHRRQREDGKGTQEEAYDWHFRHSPSGRQNNTANTEGE